jgi:hypothetical protein
VNQGFPGITLNIAVAISSGVSSVIEIKIRPGCSSAGCSRYEGIHARKETAMARFVRRTVRRPARPLQTAQAACTTSTKMPV